MALSRNGSVIIATADGDTLASLVNVCGVKVVGGASGMTVNIKKTNTSGAILYSATVGNSSEKFEEIEFRCMTGIYVNISAGGGTVYIYTE